MRRTGLDTCTTFPIMDVHKVRFIEHDPKTIDSLAFSDIAERPRLAVSRSDSSIEIWATSDGEHYYKDRRIPGRSDTSVEKLVWSGSRLFSAGLSGHIHEWNLVTLRPKETLNSPGGAVWCLRPNAQRTLLAAGCEEGMVLLLDISGDNLVHVRSLDKQEGRLLSLAWQPAGDYIMVGGADSTIRKMNVKTGHCTLRITVNEFYHRQTLIWDLKFLGNQTVVSADSLGNIQFWSCKHGTLKQSLLLHKADVLSLAVTEDERTIFAAGVDPKIVRLHRVREKSGAWVKTDENVKHTHDVKAMAVAGSRFLVSGGVDTEFVISPVKDFDYQSSIQYPAFFDCSRRFSVAAATRTLMFQSNTALKFWKMPLKDGLKSPAGATPTGSEKKKKTSASVDQPGQSDSEVSVTGSEVSVSDSSLFDTGGGLPVNFLDINVKGPLHILSSAISRDGSLVALSTIEKLWLYKIDAKDLRARCLKEDDLPCYKMAFYGDARGETMLVLATIGRGVEIVSISTKITAGLSLDHDARRLERKKESSGHPVIDFEVSSDGWYIATVDIRKRMCLYSLESCQLLTKLPRIEGQPITLAFDAASLNLILFSAPEKEMFAYRIPEESFVSVGSVEFKGGTKKLCHPSGMILLAGEENVFAVYDTRRLILVRCQGNYAGTPRMSIGEKRKSEEVHHINHQTVRSLPLILFVASLSSSDLVVVERPWTEVVKLFPPTLVKDKYMT